MDCIVHGVTKSRTQLRDFHFSLSLCEISTYSDRKKNDVEILKDSIKRKMQVTLVEPLGWEDLLEEEMATHSSVLACLEIP